MPEATTHSAHPSDAFTPPSSALPATWESVAQLLDSTHFIERALPALLREARWFGGKAHPLRAVRAVASLPVGDPAAGRIFLLEATYEDRSPETYVLPLQLAAASPEKALVIARLNGGVLFDALHDEAFRDALFELVLRGKSVPGVDGATVGICGAALKAKAAELALPLISRALAAEQSNSAIVYGGRFFLKLYRKPEAGENPDAEIIRFLSERRHFAHVPAFCGAIEHRPATGQPRTLALLVANVPGEGDAWKLTLASLRRSLDRRGDDGDYPERVRQLAQRTAEMHMALAADLADPVFAPEPFTAQDQMAFCDSTRAATRQTMQLLGSKLADIPDAYRADADALLTREGEILERLSALSQCEVIATKTRHHGDYHLGQVLDTGSDFVILDFEGEPARPLAERRMKRSPLRDVAGMLRSFHYAAHSALPRPTSLRDREAAEAWSRNVSRTFLEAWLARAKGASFIPANPAALKAMLEVHLIEKAIYEIGYELNHRPDWVFIPVLGVAQILDEGITSSP